MSQQKPQPENLSAALHCSQHPPAGSSFFDSRLSFAPAEEPQGFAPVVRADNGARQVERRLLELGIPPHIKGFSYIREAVRMLLESEEKIHGITKILYPEIASLHGTTGTRVERAIRHAIELSWSRGCAGESGLFSGRAQKPSNAEFLAFLSRSISLELHP